MTPSEWSLKSTSSTSSLHRGTKQIADTCVETKYRSSGSFSMWAHEGLNRCRTKRVAAVDLLIAKRRELNEPLAASPLRQRPPARRPGSADEAGRGGKKICFSVCGSDNARRDGDSDDEGRVAKGRTRSRPR
jgi:hypothetical protein